MDEFTKHELLELESLWSSSIPFSAYPGTFISPVMIFSLRRC